MELKRRIVDLLFFFLNDEWGLRRCEEKGLMMMVIMMKMGS
jgi:hypothetical protein